MSNGLTKLLLCIILSTCSDVIYSVVRVVFELYYCLYYFFILYHHQYDHLITTNIVILTKL